MSENQAFIATKNELEIFVSVIVGACGISLIFLLGFFLLDQIGWLDTSAHRHRHPHQPRDADVTSSPSSSCERRKAIPGGGGGHHGMSWMYRDVETFPRAQLMAPQKDGQLCPLAATKEKGDTAAAVGYVNKLFSDILRDEQTDDDDDDDDVSATSRGKQQVVTVSAEVNRDGKKLKGLSILPQRNPSARNANELTSFKPSTSLHANARKSMDNTDATVL